MSDYATLIRTLVALGDRSSKGIYHQAARAITDLLNEIDQANQTINGLRGSSAKTDQTCRGCHKGVTHTPGKRQRVWCSEKCRSRYRRDRYRPVIDTGSNADRH